MKKKIRLTGLFLTHRRPILLGTVFMVAITASSFMTYSVEVPEHSKFAPRLAVELEEKQMNSRVNRRYMFRQAADIAGNAIAAELMTANIPSVSEPVPVPMTQIFRNATVRVKSTVEDLKEAFRTRTSPIEEGKWSNLEDALRSH